jgi:hypothetical protein
MRTIKHLRGRIVQFGGEVHEGWLPRGASVPQPTAVERVSIDLRILAAGGSAYVLEWSGSTRQRSGDTWHFSLADALAEAERDFGVGPDEWQDAADPT